MWKVFLGLLCMLQIGCLPKIVPYQKEETFVSVDGVPDYTSLDYWAAHPSKWDPSDSIQTKIGGSVNERSVDVFFLYPTSFTDGIITDGQPANARIDDPYLNKKTDYTSILYQASVFNESCNIYAPRYRQAHISMYYNKDTVRVKQAFDLAYSDVKTAFRQFLEWNKGRPFIIASHSQGTTHASRLMAEMIDNDQLRDRLVAAYLVGMPVAKSMFKKIELCRDTTESGCFMSWRTFQDGYINPYISPKDTSIAVVNPINWRTDDTRTNRDEHLGAILYNFQRVYRHTHEAQVVGNALYISKPKFPGSFVLRMENYHAGDYNLFYVNVREDVKRRIRNYYLRRG